MKTIRLVSSCLILAVCSHQSLAASAANLKSVLVDAIHQNPGYQQDIADFHIIAENVPQRRAALLPQLDSIAEWSRERHARSGRGNGYVSTNHVGLDLTQTIFDGEAIKELDVAELATKAAAYNLLAQQQQLIINVANAYFQVLEAQDLLGYTKQQLRFTSEQLSATQTKFKHGEATITELEQVKGRYVLLKGELYTAKINLFSAQQALYALADKKYPTLVSLANFHLITPTPNNVNKWLEILRKQNLTLLADQYSVQSLRNKIIATKAKYLPVLDAVSTYDTQQFPGFNDNNVVVGHHTDNFAVGASLTWPIFQGGLRYAQVRQVGYEFAQITAKMHEDYLSAQQQTQSSFNDVVQGIYRIRANSQAITTNQSALNHAEEGYRAGNETITDVLQIQTQLYTSQRQYANDYYSYLLSILLLKQAAGTLSVDNLLT